MKPYVLIVGSTLILVLIVQGLGIRYRINHPTETEIQAYEHFPDWFK